MQKHLRKLAWLILAMTAAMSLAVATVFAHEGRPVGDYRFIVGWLEEPAYEGTPNSVSVRVNKIVDAEVADSMGVEQEEHGEPGHHGEETPEATPAMSQEEQDTDEGADHHGSETTDADEGEGHHGAEDKEDADSGAQHGTEDSGGQATGDGNDTQDGMTSMSHGEDDHHATTVEASGLMTVDFNVTADLIGGANVEIFTEGFAFAPESVNGAHVAGEGHAHIYVAGVKVARVYTPWFYLRDLTPGEHEIRVTLNANSHEEYTVSGNNVQAVSPFTYHDPHGHSHAPDTWEADNRMAVGVRHEPDGPNGATLFVDAEGLTFAPQHAGDHHVSGEGHAHVSVNGADYGRFYGGALQLSDLAPGENEVTVTLNTNDFSDYTWSGQKVQATATIDVAESTSGEESGHDGGSSSSLIVPQGAAKPLASMAGQGEGVAVPVEGLEGSLQVEVTHVASGVSRSFALKAAWGDPGHYVAGLIPTASGVYEFRVFGSIDGMDVDETFVSAGGGGGFDDIQTSADLQFPEQLPEMREVVGAVQGARDIAQQAQDTALAAQAGGGEDGDGGSALAVVALIIGIVGALLGAGGIFLAVQARRSV